MAENEAIVLLRSIDASLKSLLAASRQARPVKADLDGEHGDPVIKAKDPRDWHGEPMTGKRFSQCPADYLDLLADRYDYFAEKETDEKKAGYNRLDAARARGWAERIRAGYKAPSDDAEPFEDGRW